MVYRKSKQYCGFKICSDITDRAVEPEEIKHLDEGVIYEGEILEKWGEPRNLKIRVDRRKFIKPNLEYFEEPTTLEVMQYLKLQKKSEHGSMKV